MLVILLLSDQGEGRSCKSSLFVAERKALKLTQKISGGDALKGDTRTHPEHDG